MSITIMPGVTKHRTRGGRVTVFVDGRTAGLVTPPPGGRGRTPEQAELFRVTFDGGLVSHYTTEQEAIEAATGFGVYRWAGQQRTAALTYTRRMIEQAEGELIERRRGFQVDMSAGRCGHAEAVRFERHVERMEAALLELYRDAYALEHPDDRTAARRNIDHVVVAINEPGSALPASVEQEATNAQRS